jgi:hypothetical protein
MYVVSFNSNKCYFDDDDDDDDYLPDCCRWDDACEEEDYCTMEDYGYDNDD